MLNTHNWGLIPPLAQALIPQSAHSKATGGRVVTRALRLLLQERAAKGKLLKSALKAGRRQEPTPRRRISFAAGRAEPGAHQHSQDEDEEAEQEEEEEEEQEQARQEEVKRGRTKRPAAQQPPQQDGRSTASERTDGQQAAAPRRVGRSTMKAVDTDAGPLGSLPSSGLEQVRERWSCGGLRDDGLGCACSRFSCFAFACCA